MAREPNPPFQTVCGSETESAVEMHLQLLLPGLHATSPHSGSAVHHDSTVHAWPISEGTDCLIHQRITALLSALQLSSQTCAHSLPALLLCAQQTIQKVKIHQSLLGRREAGLWKPQIQKARMQPNLSIQKWTE